MQFSQLTTIFALAASATATALPVKARGNAPSYGGGHDDYNGGYDGGYVQVCRWSDGSCHYGDSDDCYGRGGDAYKCQSNGLVNLLNCDSILSGDSLDLNVLDIL